MHTSKFDNVNVLSIFEYDEAIKSVLFQIKGLGDISLASNMLEKFCAYLKIRYHGYYLVPAPSVKESDVIRGFNHVEEIFKPLKLEFLCIVTKRLEFKQSDLSYVERQNVGKKLDIKDGKKVEGKKILIVDDLKTTGATIRAMINLIKPYKPKKIEVLTLAFTKVNT